jgi:hypothetical protein
VLHLSLAEILTYCSSARGMVTAGRNDLAHALSEQDIQFGSDTVHDLSLPSWIDWTNHLPFLVGRFGRSLVGAMNLKS